jgi:cysteine desulfurase
MAAADLVEGARAQVAELLSARSAEIVFTSGATESINLGIRGSVSSSLCRDKKRVLVGATEHKAVLEAAQIACSENGLQMQEVPVLSDGTLDIDAFDKMISNDVAVVAVMHVNNETGVINPINLISEIAHRNSALIFSDLTQSCGKLNVNVKELGVDFGAYSSHKIYGPKGVGAFFADRRIMRSLNPLIVGGGHEGGMRSGTQNVPGIVGFGAAARLAGASLHDYQNHVKSLRRFFLDEIELHIPETRINGSDNCVDNTVNLLIKGADANAVMSAMPNVCVSSGSACQSAVPAPSHVLIEMGLDRTSASESIRFSFGKYTSKDEVAKAVKELSGAVKYVRSVDERVQIA